MGWKYLDFGINCFVLHMCPCSVFYLLNESLRIYLFGLLTLFIGAVRIGKKMARGTQEQEMLQAGFELSLPI